MCTRLLLLLVLALLPLGSSAESTVWQLVSDRGKLTIAGSIHVLRASDYPLPPEFDIAYENSDRIVFETDIRAFVQPAVQQQLMTAGAYPAGQTLKQHLEPEVYAQLEEHCRKQGIPLLALQGFRPWFLVIVLTMQQLQTHGVGPENGLEMHYSTRAAKDGKLVSGLETTEEHIRILGALGGAFADSAVSQFLQEMELLPKILATLVQAWRRGDEAAIAAYIKDAFKDCPDAYRIAVVERNRRWVDRIEALIRSGERALVVVGSGHLAGPDSLLDMLAKRGHRFSKLQAATAEEPERAAPQPGTAP